MALLGASEQIVHLMHLDPKVNTTGGRDLDAEGQTVESNMALDNVKFSYPTKPDVQVLKGVSFDVIEGKKKLIALCGQSGCGKSSIISLVERFYDPTSGALKFNGVDIKDLEPSWYHNKIGLVQ